MTGIAFPQAWPGCYQSVMRGPDRGSRSGGLAKGIAGKAPPRAPGRKQSPTRNLLERLRHRSADVLRFADLPGLAPFTNNTGERGPRPVKTVNVLPWR